MVNKELVGIDWTDTTLRRELPWDSNQWIEVRRLSGEEKRKRDNLIAKRCSRDEERERMEIELTHSEMQAYEWEHCIIGYRLLDSNGKYLTFENPKDNRERYARIRGKLETFIEDLIREVNKDEEEAQKEIAEVEKNSPISSEEV